MNIIVWKNEIEGNMYILPYSKKSFENTLTSLIHDERKFPDPCGRDIASIHFHLACGVDDFNYEWDRPDRWIEGVGIADVPEEGVCINVREHAIGSDGSSPRWGVSSSIAGRFIDHEDVSLKRLSLTIESHVREIAEFDDEPLIDVTDIAYNFGAYT